MAEILEADAVDVEPSIPDEVAIMAPLPLPGMTINQLRMRMQIEGMLHLLQDTHRSSGEARMPIDILHRQH